MSNLNGVTGEKIRAVITRRIDTYRPSYGRVSVSFPRMCVFSATTNETEWNKSTTGARRFWPVTCGTICIDWLAKNREQLFAEAVVRFSQGEPWWNVPKEYALFEQRLREERDVWKNTIDAYVCNQTEMTTEQILDRCLGIEDKSKWNQTLKNRVASVMRQLGWIVTVTSRDGKSCRVWTNRNLPRTPSLSAENPFHD
jgi:predicted P-loop ATPase